MKPSYFFAVASALLALVSAGDGDGKLTFTYQTLTDHMVKTVTTTYAASSVKVPEGPERATSYHVNPEHNAYPTFSSITGPLASSAPAPGLLNATDLAGAFFALVAQRKVA